MPAEKIAKKITREQGDVVVRTGAEDDVLFPPLKCTYTSKEVL